ncbi:MAG: hypothetical protein KHY31_09760 [Clostridiales bacterium]|nr:hypothetical protein [Clostridiales bacterium]
MGFIYTKEMIEGVRSSRKIFGIPVYKREDSKDGAVKRKYFMGIWSTFSDRYQKCYYFLGLRILKRKNLSGWNYEQDKQLKNLENIVNEQRNEIQNVLKSISQMHNKLNKIYAETSNVKTLIQCQELHKQTFGPYKNSMLGRTVVLVASGPTVKYHQPIQEAIYVGVNNACALENVKFDYLFCQDFYMDEEKRKNIALYRGDKCKKFFGRIPDRRMEHCRTTPGAQHVRRAPRYLVDMAKAEEYYVYDYQMSNIAYDIELEPLHPGGIAFSAMQFILHCHPEKIYIVGCDCSSGFFYQSDITFDNSWMVKIWKEFKIYIDELYPDIKIISLNPVGLRGIFEDHYTEEYLEEVEI